MSELQAQEWLAEVTPNEHTDDPCLILIELEEQIDELDGCDGDCINCMHRSCCNSSTVLLDRR